MRRKGFTLIELLFVVIIIGILATIMYPQFEGFRIRAEMSELYNTVTMIETAEDLFYFKHGDYAAMSDGPDTSEDLPYTTIQGNIDNFRNILNIDVPGMDSTFVYGVYYDPARIYIRVREHFSDWGILCYGYIEGANKGTWVVVAAHPWSIYVVEAKLP